MPSKRILFVIILVIGLILSFAMVMSAVAELKGEASKTSVTSNASKTITTKKIVNEKPNMTIATKPGSKPLTIASNSGTKAIGSKPSSTAGNPVSKVQTSKSKLEVMNDKQVKVSGPTSGNVCFNPTTNVFTVENDNTEKKFEYKNVYAVCKGTTEEVEESSGGINVKNCDSDYMEVSCYTGKILSYSGTCGGVNSMEGIQPKGFDYDDDWGEFPSSVTSVELKCTGTSSWMEIHLICIREKP